MWNAQGSILLSENPKKLKYCQWLRSPLFGPMLLNVIIQSKKVLVKLFANFMSQKTL